MKPSIKFGVGRGSITSSSRPLPPLLFMCLFVIARTFPFNHFLDFVPSHETELQIQCELLSMPRVERSRNARARPRRAPKASQTARHWDHKQLDLPGRRKTNRNKGRQRIREWCGWANPESRESLQAETHTQKEREKQEKREEGQTENQRMVWVTGLRDAKVQAQRRGELN